MNKVTSYLKNVGKSISYATVDVTKSMIPDVEDFIDTNQELFKSVYAAAIRPDQTIKTGKQIVMESKLYKEVRTGIDNVLEDIKTGNFYNKARSDAAIDAAADIMSGSGDDFFKDNGMDDFSDFGEFDFGDDEFNDDSPEAGVTKGDLIIADSVTASGNASAQLISKTVANSSTSIIKGNIASTNALMAQNISLISGVRTSISGVHQSINAILEFANDQIITGINNQSTFFEKSTSLMQENNAILKEMLEMQRNTYAKQQESSDSNDQFSQVFSGSLDLTEYFKIIKKNAIKADPTGMLGTINSDDGGMLSSMLANPLGSLVTSLVKGFMPANTVKSIISFNKTLGNLFPALISKLNFWRNDSDSSGLQQMLGKIFGLSVQTKKSIDTSKYTKGAVPFDGYTRRAIIDVIPEYLSKIESFLSKNSQRVYDYETGKWTTAKNIKKEYESEYKRRVIDSSFDNGLNDDFKNFVNEMKKKKYFSNKNDYDNFIKEWDKVRQYTVEELKGHFNINQIKQELSSDDKTTHLSDAMEKFLDTVAKGPVSKILGVSTSTMENQNSFSQRMTNAETGIDVYRKLNDNSKMDDHIVYDQKHTDQIVGSKIKLLSTDLDKNGLSILDYLRNLDMNVSFIAEGGIGYGQLFDLKMAKLQRLSKARIKEDNKTFKTTYKLNPLVSPFSEGLQKAQEKAKKEEESFKKSYAADLDEDDKTLIVALNQQKLSKNNSDVDSDELEGYGRFSKEKNKWQEQMDKIPGDTFSEKFKNTENWDQKYALIMGSLNDIAKKPGLIINGLISKANESIYHMLFKEETDEVDQTTGKKIKGLFNKMLNQMQHHWTILTTNLSEKIIDPLAKKLGLGDKWKNIKDKVANTSTGKNLNEFVGEVGTNLKQDLKSAVKIGTGGFNEIYQRLSSSEYGTKSQVAKNNHAIKNMTKEMNNLLGQNLNTAEDAAQMDELISNIDKKMRAPISTDNFIKYEILKQNLKIYQDQLIKQKQEELGTEILPLKDLSGIINKVKKFNINDLEEAELKNNETNNSPIKPNPVSWNGVDYPSERALCKALGLKYSTYQSRKRNGWTLEERINGKPVQGLAFGGTHQFDKGTKITVSSPGEDVYVVRNKKASKEQIEKDAQNENNVIDILNKTLGEKLNIKGFAKEGVHTDKTDSDETDSDTNAYDDIKKLSKRIEKLEEKNKELQENKQHTITDDIIDGVKDGAVSIGTDLVAGIKKTFNNNIDKNEEKKLRKTVGNIVEETGGTGAQTLSKAIIGGGLGLLSGIAGGPIIGAAVGAGYSLMKNSKTIQEMLYGKDIEYDENGYIVKSEGGLLGKNAHNTLKKYVPDAGKYGIVGAVSSLFLPFGPLAGAAIGAGIGLLKNSSTMNNMLFGDEEGLFNKNRKEKIKKYFPRAAAGAIGGLFLGPFGVLGNAVLGSGIGLLTGTEEFQNLIYGEEGSNGERIGGLKNTINDYIIAPLQEFGTNFKDDFFGFIKENMIDPLNRAITPITSEIAYQTKKVVFGIPKMFINLGKDYLYKPIAEVVNTSVVQPLANLTKKLFGGLFDKVKGIVSLPFRTIGRLGDHVRKKQIREGRDQGSAKSRIQFAKNKKMGNYLYREFDEAIDDNNNNEEYLKELTARTAMLAYGPDYFEKEVKKTGRKISKIISKYVKVGLLNKGGREYKKITKAIKENDIETAIKLLNQVKDTKKGGRLTDDEANTAIAELEEANQNYQAARKARDEMKDLNEEENREYLRSQFGDKIDKWDPKKLYEYANREYAKFTDDNQGLSTKDIFDPSKVITEQGTKLNETLIEIRDILINTQTGKFSDPDDLVELFNSGNKAKAEAEEERKGQKLKIKNRLSKKGIDFKDQTDKVLDLLYSNEKIYELFLFAWDEHGTVFSSETIEKLCNLKLDDNQISLLKENPFVAELPEEVLKKFLNKNRNDHGSILHSTGIQRKNLKQLNNAIKAGAEIKNIDQARTITSGSYAEKYQHEERLKYFERFKLLDLLDKPIKTYDDPEGKTIIKQKDILDINKGLSFDEMNKILRYNNGEVEGGDFANVLSNDFKEKTNIRGHIHNFINDYIWNSKTKKGLKTAGNYAMKAVGSIGTIPLTSAGVVIKGTRFGSKVVDRNIRDFYRFGLEGWKNDKNINRDVASDFGDPTFIEEIVDDLTQFGIEKLNKLAKSIKKIYNKLPKNKISSIINNTKQEIDKLIKSAREKIKAQSKEADGTDQNQETVVKNKISSIINNTKQEIDKLIKSAREKIKAQSKEADGTDQNQETVENVAQEVVDAGAENTDVQNFATGGTHHDTGETKVTITSEGEDVHVVNNNDKQTTADNQQMEDAVSDQLNKSIDKKSKIKTFFTENGIIKYIQNKRGEWKMSKDSTTKETLERGNEEEQNQYTMISQLKSVKDGIFGIFNRNKEKDEAEKKESWIQKLFGFDLSKITGALKFGGIIVGGLTAIGAIKNAWDDEGEDGMMHKIAGKVSTALSPLFEKLQDVFSGVGDWFTSSGKHKGGGLSKFMEEYVFPNLFTGMNVIFGKVLPALIEAFIVNIPTLIGSGLKGVARLFGWTNDEGEGDADLKISDAKTLNKKSLSVSTDNSNLYNSIIKGADQAADNIRNTVINDDGTISTPQSNNIANDIVAQYNNTDSKESNNTDSKSNNTDSKSNNTDSKESNNIANDIVAQYNNTDSKESNNTDSKSNNIANDIVAQYNNTDSKESNNTDEPVMFDGVGPIYKDRECKSPVMSNELNNGLITDFYNEYGGHWVSDGDGGYIPADDSTRAINVKQSIPERIMVAAARSVLTGKSLGIGRVVKFMGKSKILRTIGGAADAGLSHIPFIGKTYKIGKTAVKGTGNIAQNISDKLAKFGNKALIESTTEQGAKEVVEQGAKEVVEQGAKEVVEQGAKVSIHNTAETIVKKGLAISKGLLERVVQFVKDGLERIFKNSTILNKIAEGLKTSGKKATKEAAEEVAESIIKKFIKLIPGKLKEMGSEVVTRISAAISSAGLVTIAFIAVDFLTGMDQAESILGITETNIVQEIIAGLANAINGALFYGLIPISFVIDILVDIVFPIFQIDMVEYKKQRAEADRLREEYNTKYGTELSTEEYLVQEYSFTGKFIADYKKRAKEDKERTEKITEQRRKDNKTYTLTSNPLAQTMSMNGTYTSSAPTKFISTLPGLANNPTPTTTTKTPNIPSFGAMNAGFGTGFVSQLDPKYKNQKFNIPGDTQVQTLGDSGCAPAAAANVLNMYAGKGMEDASKAALKYKGKDSGVTPDYFTDYLGRNGINTYPTMDKQQMINGIASGQPTILLGMDPSNKAKTPYGSASSHYVVATGMDGRGNVIIQDPESKKPNALYPMSDVINQSHFGMLTGRGKGSRRNKNSNYRKRLPKAFFGKGYSRTVHQDLATFSSITASELNKHIPSGRGFSGKGQYFINASKASGLDPRYILAHAALESSWGDSEYAKAGNFFGIGAFNSNPDNALNYANNSMEAGLINGAKWIRENYYDAGQKTLYQMIHSESGTHNYAVNDDGSPNIEWMNNIASIMDSIGGNTNAEYYEVDDSVSSSSSSGPSTIFDALWQDISKNYDPRLLEFLGYSTEESSTTTTNPGSGDVASAQAFYEKYNGIGVDYDKAYGVQCVDLFKQYHDEVAKGGNYIVPGSGGAYEMANDPVLDKYYDKVNLKDAQFGDWVVWGPYSNGGGQYGHVAMYTGMEGDRIKAWGTNQDGKGAAARIDNLSAENVTAVLRLKDTTSYAAKGSGKNKNSITSYLLGKGTQQPKSLSKDMIYEYRNKNKNKISVPHIPQDLDIPSYTLDGKGSLPSLDNTYTTNQRGSVSNITNTTESTSKIEKLISVVIEVLGTIADNSSKLSEIVSLLSKALDVELTNNDISNLKSNNAQIKNKLANALKSQGSANGMGNTITNASTESLASAMYAIARA